MTATSQSNGYHRIEYKCKCGSCKGTGIYVGMAERSGAGVVCSTCKGTGCRHVVIEYEDFDERVRRDDVERVYQVNSGICIGKGEGLSLEDFGGLPYDAWRDGAPFQAGMENRKFTCPAWWYQSADYKRKPNWDECGWGAFSACKHFGNKQACWDRWDQEQVK